MLKKLNVTDIHVEEFNLFFRDCYYKPSNIVVKLENQDKVLVKI